MPQPVCPTWSPRRSGNTEDDKPTVLWWKANRPSQTRGCDKVLQETSVQRRGFNDIFNCIIKEWQTSKRGSGSWEGTAWVKGCPSLRPWVCNTGLRGGNRGLVCISSPRTEKIQENRKLRRCTTMDQGGPSEAQWRRSKSSPREAA